MSGKELIATVWLFTHAGREAAGHTDAARAWAEFQDLPGGTRERGDLADRLTPVEINIALKDIPRAVAKWEAVAGLPGVCHAEIHERDPWTTKLNEVLDWPTEPEYESAGALRDGKQIFWCIRQPKTDAS